MALSLHDPSPKVNIVPSYRSPTTTTPGTTTKSSSSTKNTGTSPKTPETGSSTAAPGATATADVPSDSGTADTGDDTGSSGSADNYSSGGTTGPDTSSGDSASPAAASSDASSTGTILGIPSTYAYVGLSLAELGIIGAIAFFLYRRQASSRHRHRDRASGESDVDSASDGGPDSTQQGASSHRRRRRHDSSDSEMEERSLGRLAGLEKAERLATLQSLYSAAAKDTRKSRGMPRRDSNPGRLPPFDLSQRRDSESDASDNALSNPLLNRGRGRYHEVP
ncbi:hypothetical protein JCM8202_001515 [Rhodotorula sphaerocarpa]